MIDDLTHNAALVFDKIETCFKRAAEASPDEMRETDLWLAGRRVTLRVVGSKLAERLVSPFQHLRCDAAVLPEPGLIVEIWDEQATGISLDGRLNRLGWNVDPGGAAAQFSFHRHRSLTLSLDLRNLHLFGCCSGADDLSLYELGRPFHAPLVHWHNGQSFPIVHAGLVARNGRGVLLAGSAGSGKSTCALMCTYNGFSFLSDDLIALQAQPGGSFRGHSIYNSTYLESDHLVRFPFLRPYGKRSQYADEEKTLVLLSDVLPTRLERAAEIKVIVLPEVGEDAGSTYRTVSPSKALLALAPSSLPINRNLGQRGFDLLARLVESVPCYRMRLGSDLVRIPLAAEQLLAEIG